MIEGRADPRVTLRVLFIYRSWCLLILARMKLNRKIGIIILHFHHIYSHRPASHQHNNVSSLHEVSQVWLSSNQTRWCMIPAFVSWFVYHGLSMTGYYILTVCKGWGCEDVRMWGHVRTCEDMWGSVRAVRWEVLTVWLGLKMSGAEQAWAAYTGQWAGQLSSQRPPQLVPGLASTPSLPPSLPPCHYRLHWPSHHTARPSQQSTYRPSIFLRTRWSTRDIQEK